jgi:hypothetical protein
MYTGQPKTGRFSFDFDSATQVLVDLSIIACLAADRLRK